MTISLFEYWFPKYKAWLAEAGIHTVVQDHSLGNMKTITLFVYEPVRPRWWWFWDFTYKPLYSVKVRGTFTADFAGSLSPGNQRDRVLEFLEGFLRSTTVEWSSAFSQRSTRL